jgi:flagellar hook protein FlgE
MINALSSSLSALTAMGKKMGVIADNVANAQSKEYKKSRVTLEEGPSSTVRPVTERIDSPGPIFPVPGEDGLVLEEGSNVDLAEELPQALLTRRHFEANLKMIGVQEEMLESLLDIFA